MSEVAPPEPRLAVPERIDPSVLATFDPAAHIVDLGGATMGTTWRVRLALARGRDAAPVERAIAARLDGLEAELSHWRPDSGLSRFNRSEPGAWVALPRDFAAVVASALNIAERSRGAFDPALGRLTDAWGLGAHRRPDPPACEQIAAARASSGWRLLDYDPTTSRLRQPGEVWLDLSGIAKGYAADAVADLLAERGLCHALIEIGGEFVGRGLRPDGDPWWVELETPPHIAAPRLRVALHQLAVATSGDYERGQHTIDPADGHPTRRGATAVSVLHPSCMAADAWATALGVVAPADAIRLANDHALAARVLMRDGRELLSAALRRML